MADIPEHARLFSIPNELGLRRPVAIVAFGGWIDAGAGGTGAVRYLINALSPEKLAEIDPEEFYSFTDTRPLIANVSPGERVLHWPRVEMHAARLADPADTDILLFVAPEPNLRWRTFAGTLLDLMQGAGVSVLVCVGSFFGPVHHRSPVSLTGWATTPELRVALRGEGISYSRYEGPTGFVSALVSEAEKRGIPSASITGVAPSYIQGVPNPRVSHALLKAASGVTGLQLQLDLLERGARALTRQVDRLLAEQPELQDQVRRMLESMSVAEPDVDEPAVPDQPIDFPVNDPNVELPSPQAVVRDLEEFLKRLQQGDSGASGSEPST